MTRRKRLQPKRIEAVGLDANAEMVAVGWAGWWVEESAESRTWWLGIATVHGDRLRQKWVDAAPGTRPAFDWVVRLPEWPLLTQPDGFDGSRKSVVSRLAKGGGTSPTFSKSVVISGRRYWHCGQPWQPAQVDILRECGEVDAAEYRRHLEWVEAGAPFSYTLDEGWACGWLDCGITHREVFQ
jgi:hypothetical protein